MTSLIFHGFSPYFTIRTGSQTSLIIPQVFAPSAPAKNPTGSLMASTLRTQGFNENKVVGPSIFHGIEWEIHGIFLPKYLTNNVIICDNFVPPHGYRIWTGKIRENGHQWMEWNTLWQTHFRWSFLVIFFSSARYLIGCLCSATNRPSLCINKILLVPPPTSHCCISIIFRWLND